MPSSSTQPGLYAKQINFATPHHENAKRTDELNTRREQSKMQHGTNGRALPLPESGCRKIAVAQTRVST